MSDPLDFLDDAKASNAPASVEPAVVETPPPPQSQPEPVAAPIEPALKAEPSIPPGYIPLAAQLDEREKRQAAERRADEAERRIAELSKKPEQAIDPFTDPDGYAKSLNDTVEKRSQDILFTVSKRFAVRDHTLELVTSAEEAALAEAKANPAFFQTITGQPDPYDFMVKWHKRQLAISKIGDNDPEAWAEQWAKAKGYVIPEPQAVPETGQARDATGKFVAAAPPPATSTPLPKPSLASAPAASGKAPTVPHGEGQAFDAVFK